MNGSVRVLSDRLSGSFLRCLGSFLIAMGSFGVVLSTAAPADAGLYDNTNTCVAGTLTIKHGVTAVRVTAIGQAGEDGTDVTENRLGGPEDWQGGAGGLASRVETTVPVTAGQTLYVGVANGTMGGGARPADGMGGKGGSASWVVTADPRVNGDCKPTQASSLVVAAGGGGGGGAGNRHTAHPGGAGGTEASGGNGGDGHEGSDIFTGPDGSGGDGGHYPSTTGGGGGGLGGDSTGCTSGQAGFAGAALNGGRGGEAGVPILNHVDCSTPPPDCEACQFVNDAYGGGGGGGGGGYWGGGGGGGADSGGWGAGGGGASGRSFARNSTSYTVTSTRSTPLVIVEPVTTPPEVTSGGSATFTRGTFGTFTGTATGVETPFVRFKGTLPNGVTNSSGQWPDDGTGTGEATLAGTPSQDGVFNLSTEACNESGCDEEPFVLTVNGAPSINSLDKITFVVGSAGSHVIRTGGYPAPAITKSGGPAWLSLTDNGDGTATLTGTPPAGAASTSVNLTAANGIGSNATQTLNIKVVTALSVTPSTVHLVPGNSNPIFIGQAGRGFRQQLQAIGTFADGSTGNITDYVRWDSSAPTVASVSDSAFVIANALGTATVTARTASAVTATSSIVVAMPLSITVSPGTVSLLGGQTQQFTAFGCYGNPCSANLFDISDNVIWSVSNPTSAHVDVDGLATAHPGGTTSAVFAEVFAGISGLPSVRGEGDITVTHGNVVEVVVTPDDRTVPTRTTVRYKGMLRYQDGTLVHDSPFVTWSASGIATATIGAAGDAYSPDPGTLTVRGTFTNPGGGTAFGETTLTVIRTPSELVVEAANGQNLTPLVKGTTKQYRALARYSDGAPDVDVTNGVQWLSGNSALMDVSPSGVVTAKNTQDIDVPLFASYTFDNGSGGTSRIDGQRAVPLTILPPVSLSITPVSPNVLHPNDTLQFTATGTYADGSTIDLTNLVKTADPDGSNATYHVMWSSSNTFVGEIGTTGFLHVPDAASAAGTTTVSASIIANGGVLHSNNVVVTVTDPLHHITLRSLNPGGSPSTLVAGTSTAYPYAVEGFDVRNHSLGDVTAGSTITISPDGACDPVLLTCGATVADIGLNRHTIRATNPNAVNPNSNSITIQILRTTTARIEITGGSTSIVAGSSTAPYHVTGYDAYENSFDATNQTSFTVQPVEGTSGCDGSPGNTPICHAVTAGAHTVRASAFSGAFVELLPLWVHPNPTLTRIVLSGGASVIPVGTTTPAYTVTGYDAYDNGGAITNQTELSITPDGTCDNTAFTCRAASLGDHTVTARRLVDGLTSTKALKAVAPPTLAVSYTPNAITQGGFSTLRFTLTNPNPNTDLTGIGFQSTVPASFVANQFINGCNRGTSYQFQTPTGGFVMSGVSLVQGESCTFQYIGRGMSAGLFSSITSGITSVQGGSSSASATATLDVSGPPVLTKRFVAGSVMIGSTTPLTFTVTNPNSTLTLTGIGFMDALPAGLSFASTTITGSCGTAALSIQGNTLFMGPDGANGAIGSGAHGATLAPGASCTFSADVRADTLGSKTNSTSNVTSAERGTGPVAQATVVVTPVVDHFDILMAGMSAGVPADLAVTAYDRFNNVVTGYAGTPTLTGTFSDSATGCGPADADPCSPVYEMSPFVDGVGTARVTAFKTEQFRQVTVADGAVVSPSSQGLNVGPGAFDHITLEGGSGSIAAGGFSFGYGTRRWDKYGNLRAGSSHTLSISPDGLCNGFDSCTAQVADHDGSHHTVTAVSTLARADGTFPVASLPLVVGHGPVSRITVDGGNRTLVAGQTTQPYTVFGWDLFDNPIDDLPTSDVHFTIDANGSCNDLTRKCTATVADPPGSYHLVRASHISGPFNDADLLVVSPAALDHLVVAPATATVSAGQFQAYVATGYDAYGNGLGDKTAQATFTIDDGDCVGSSCHSTTAGDRTVTATLGSATGTATLTVQAGQLHHITLTGGSPTIVAGTNTAPWVVNGFDAAGNPLGNVTSGATLSISGTGSCNQVAHTCTATDVDNGGFHVVTATHLGAIGGPTTTAHVVVTAPVVTIDHITLTGGSSSIVAGTDTAPYVATAYDINNVNLGPVTNAVSLSITGTGSCNDVAHTCTATDVDTGGTHHTVTATHPTATHPTATSDVVVTSAGGGGGGGGGGALDHFGIAVHDLDAGDQATLAVTAYDSAGAAVTDYAGTPVLTGTLGDSAKACGPAGEDPCAPRYYMGAFVDGVASAFVTAFKAETGRTLTLTDGSVQSTSDPFDVRPGTADTAKLSGGSVAIVAGTNTAAYVVTGYDVFGNETGDLTGDSTFEIFPGGTYGSCTGAVCTSTYAGENGVVAHPPVGNPLQADLTVTAGAVKYLEVNGDSFLQAGQDTNPFTVDGFDQWFNYAGDVIAGSTLSIGPHGSCEQVDHTCTATDADSGGDYHTVTAKYAGAVDGTTGLVVVPGPLDHLAITPEEANANAGSTQPYTATTRDSFGNVIEDVTQYATFEIGGGTCTGADCGANVSGDKTVTASYRDGDLYQANALLHVLPGPLDHITLVGGSTSVDAGVATAAYQVLGWDEFDNALGDVTAGSTLGIAPNGTCNQIAHTCTPTAGGSHTVTATHTATGFTANKALSVTATVSADVRLTKTGPATLVPGANITYNLSARNFGPNTATGVTVSDPFPAGTSYVSSTNPSGWTCTTVGALTCTKPTLTTGDGAQAFTLTLYVPPTATGPLSNTATVSATTPDPTPANNNPAAVVSTVGCGTTRTITGLFAGDLTLSGNNTTCLRNLTVTGKLSVLKGASVVAVNTIVGGAMSAIGAGSVAFCGSTLRSSVSIDGSKGFVLFGDPGDDACAGNTVVGNVGITGGLAGLNLRSNTLRSSVTIEKNKGGGPFPIDANPIIAANSIGGRLACKSNTPAPINAGQPNTAINKSGQCATL